VPPRGKGSMREPIFKVEKVQLGEEEGKGVDRVGILVQLSDIYL
jgi:hypothetical protein